MSHFSTQRNVPTKAPRTPATALQAPGSTSGASGDAGLTQLGDAVTKVSSWTSIVEALAGKPPPPLPALPGRRCRGLHDPAPGVDPVRQQWDAAERKLPPGWWASVP